MNYNGDETTCNNDPCGFGNCEWGGNQCVEVICQDDDGVCTEGCTPYNDNDCIAECNNNGQCENGEICSCQDCTGEQDSCQEGYHCFYDTTNPYLSYCTSDCPIGTTLCPDGSCSNNCLVIDDGFPPCNNNGQCEDGEGCTCQDCDGKQDTCEEGAVCSYVQGICIGVCGNDICELGEDIDNCPEDCGEAQCGNGVCEPGEDALSCPDDCAAQCGNGVCEPGEDALSCQDDCTAQCGNGVCEPGETPDCEQDCGGPYCGDDVKNQPWEECDGTPDCSENCELTTEPYCGDGVVNQGREECDGTTDCSENCELTTEPYCGDGELNQGYEECDDGNSKNGDGGAVRCAWDDAGGPDSGARCQAEDKDWDLYPTTSEDFEKRCCGRYKTQICKNEIDCDDYTIDDPGENFQPACHPAWKVDCNALGYSECARCINPGAAELCDGVDNNCNDEIDEGCAYQEITTSYKENVIRTEKIVYYQGRPLRLVIDTFEK